MCAGADGVLIPRTGHRVPSALLAKRDADVALPTAAAELQELVAAAGKLRVEAVLDVHAVRFVQRTRMGKIENRNKG